MLAPFAARRAVPARAAVSSWAIAEQPTPGQDVFAGLVGHELPRARLTAALARPAHAYLLTGQPGSGVERFARRFASALIGVDERMLDVGHPDLRQVEPEGTQIRMEQIRELWHDVQMRPFTAQRRVYLVWNADTMPEFAQHALLKSIEEPPSYVVVILVTSLPHMLLPTVRSRCQLIPFGHLRSDEIARALETEGVAAEAARAAAR